MSTKIFQGRWTHFVHRVFGAGFFVIPLAFYLRLYRMLYHFHHYYMLQNSRLRDCLLF